jgi:hypothetical protein
VKVEPRRGLTLRETDLLKFRLMKGPFSKAELLVRASLRSARLIRELCEEKGDSHSRLVEAPIIADELVIVGRSAAGAVEKRREHVIPCNMIVRRCHEMIADGSSDNEVAGFIRRSLRIVLLSRAECRQLDLKSGFNLKTNMPGSWVFGECAFERLTHAQIDWRPDLVDEGLAKALELRWPNCLAAS